MTIELELWYLILLPVLFIAGWFARGFESQARAADQVAAPRSMFRGLNLLLNEQHDQAIDAFIDVVKLDPETIDLHFALGNLFRRRGEIERAVRIHTHLLNRADLPARQRSNALAELGQDYLKGGLLDRAEDTFTRLLDDRQHRFDALRALLRVYQTEREWLKAIECAQKLEREAAESHQLATAHFYCELSQQSLNRNDFDGAQQYLNEALVVNRKSVRALIASADVCAKRGQTEEAVQRWLQLQTIAPEYLALVADPLSKALDSLGRRAEATSLLRKSLLDSPSVDLLDITYQRVSDWEGKSAGENLLREELKRHPSLLGFEKLLSLKADAGQGDTELDQLRKLIQTQTRKLARYRCSRCGFRAREFHWQCPGCTSWDSYPPKRIEELDAA